MPVRRTALFMIAAIRRAKFLNARQQLIGIGSHTTRRSAPRQRSEVDKIKPLPFPKSSHKFPQRLPQRSIFVIRKSVIRHFHRLHPRERKDGVVKIRLPSAVARPAFTRELPHQKTTH